MNYSTFLFSSIKSFRYIHLALQLHSVIAVALWCFGVWSNLQFYYSPDEGNELPHTATGNTWHSLTPNKADSTLQKRNGPCGTKTHMVAAGIHILVFSATFNHSDQMPISHEVSKINVYQDNHAKSN